MKKLNNKELSEELCIPDMVDTGAVFCLLTFMVSLMFSIPIDENFLGANGWGIVVFSVLPALIMTSVGAFVHFCWQISRDGRSGPIMHRMTKSQFLKYGLLCLVWPLAVVRTMYLIFAEVLSPVFACFSYFTEETK